MISIAHLNSCLLGITLAVVATALHTFFKSSCASCKLLETCATLLYAIVGRSSKNDLLYNARGTSTNPYPTSKIPVEIPHAFATTIPYALKLDASSDPKKSNPVAPIHRIPTKTR